MLPSYGALTMICVTSMTSMVKAGLCTCPGVHSDFTTSRMLELKDDVSEQVTERNRKRCCPYNFDGKICRNVGNRILCGYNRNIGSPDVGDEEVNLNNGCRIRNGRLECGYDQPPYTNIRRPPVWDDDEQNKKSNEIYETPIEDRPIKLMYKSTVSLKRTTQCIEIRERIVCKRS